MEQALRDLARGWQRYWPGADADAMAADVEARFSSACTSWQLASPELLPGGGVALTAAAGDLVLKVLPRGHPDEALMRGEAEALAHWRGAGIAVELIDRRDGGMTLLLNRLRPASPLDGTPYAEQLTIVGALVKRLHAAGEPPASLPSLDQYVEVFRNVPDVRPELDRLLASADRTVAVHADLHGGNVLRDGERWLAIDPKGVRGDPHVDVWLLLCPQAPAVEGPDEARRRVQRYSAAASLDPERAAAWVRVIARAESALSAQSAYAGWPERLSRLAQALS